MAPSPLRCCCMAPPAAPMAPPAAERHCCPTAGARKARGAGSCARHQPAARRQAGQQGAAGLEQVRRRCCSHPSPWRAEQLRCPGPLRPGPSTWRNRLPAAPLQPRCRPPAAHLQPSRPVLPPPSRRPQVPRGPAGQAAAAGPGAALRHRHHSRPAGRGAHPFQHQPASDGQRQAGGAGGAAGRQVGGRRPGAAAGRALGALARWSLRQGWC
jgi:hypothetical protein